MQPTLIYRKLVPLKWTYETVNSDGLWLELVAFQKLMESALTPLIGREPDEPDV